MKEKYNKETEQNPYAAEAEDIINDDGCNEGIEICEAEENPADSVETPPPEISAEQRYNDLFDRYQRSLAEFDNFRKRTSKEKAAMYDDGLRDTVEKLLPVIDNFERALNAVEDTDNKFYQGISMIARQLSTFLTDLGIETIEAASGDVFNHNLHYAVAHTEDKEYGANEIIDILQKGYKHKDKVLRPSMVRVVN